MNKKLIAILAGLTSFRAMYSCQGSQAVVLVDLDQEVTQQCLRVQRFRAAAQLQVKQLTNQQRAQLLEKAGDRDILHDALKGFRFHPRSRDVLIELSEDQLLDYARKYFTRSLAKGDRARGYAPLRFSSRHPFESPLGSDSPEYPPHWRQVQRNALKALTSQEMAARARFLGVEISVLYEARRYYRSMCADSFMSADRRHIESAAQRYREHLRVNAASRREKRTRVETAARALVQMATLAADRAAV